VIVVACDLLSARASPAAPGLSADVDGAWIRGTRVEPLLACYRAAAAPRLRQAIDAGRLKAADLAEVLQCGDR
jgi:molybdopterin-guanine dinucleotide biosynthesis protein A